jgi:hypothetical protein
MKKFHLLGAVCAVLLTAIPFSAAHAITVQLEFQANFGDGRLGNPPPPAPDPVVSGWFTYEAATVNSAIDSLIGIGLTIDGYSYGLADIGFAAGSSFSLCVGDSTKGECSTTARERDFVVEWNKNTLDPIQMAYSVAGQNNYWAAAPGDFDYFNVTAVPVPAAVWLFGSGLLGLVGIARRKKIA